MAKPNQPKEIKPKEDGEAGKGKNNDNMKMIVINLATTVLICVLFLTVNYVLQDNLLNTKLGKTATAQASSEEEGSAEGDTSGEEEVQRGLIVDLGDFILNLSDTAPRKYLKVNVALEVSKPEAAAAEEEAPKASGHGGGHGESAPAVDPVEAEMAQFKPAIRDAVITTLSSKTAAEVSTTAGKELAKEQIAEAVNGIFAGDREVMRVSFGQFIIQ